MESLIAALVRYRKIAELALKVSAPDVDARSNLSCLEYFADPPMTPDEAAEEKYEIYAE